MNNISQTHPHVAAEWHPTKNGDLKLDGITRGMHVKAWWRCGVCQEDWQAPVYSRVAGCGCPYCSCKKVSPKNCLAVKFPHIAAEWHPTLNGDLTPNNVTGGTKMVAWWRCPKGHNYQSTLNNRSSGGKGCPVCKGKKVSEDSNLAAQFPHIAAEWHPTLNGDVEASDVRPGTARVYWWSCSKGHAWRTSPNCRTNGRTGCPVCKESKGEKAVNEALTERGIYTRRQFKMPKCRNVFPLPFDFAIVPHGKRAALIEFQGELHYRPIEYFGGEEGFAERQMRDQLKRDFCEEKGIPLLEISYEDVEKIPDLIDEFVARLPPWSQAG
jgi:hypothetical protein